MSFQLAGHTPEDTGQYTSDGAAGLVGRYGGAAG